MPALTRLLCGKILRSEGPTTSQDLTGAQGGKLPACCLCWLAISLERLIAPRDHPCHPGDYCSGGIAWSVMLEKT